MCEWWTVDGLTVDGFTIYAEATDRIDQKLQDFEKPIPSGYH